MPDDGFFIVYIKWMQSALVIDCPQSSQHSLARCQVLRSLNIYRSENLKNYMVWVNCLLCQQMSERLQLQCHTTSVGLW